MSRFSRHSIALLIGLCLGSAALAETPILQTIPEDVLRALVEFTPEDGLKHAECEAKRTLTCTYIWGVPDSDDAARIKLGGTPDGKKLLVTAVQAARSSDFDRVLASYKDAVKVDGLGVQAVWSEMRGQLSMLAPDNVIIHVSVDRAQSADSKASAIAIATHLLTAP